MMAAWLAFVLCGEVLPGQAALDDCIDATCRITVGNGGRGTGCVFHIEQGWVYVLTAAHVVGQDPAPRCEFWRQGHQSLALEGRVLARAENTLCDAAIVVLPAAQFGGAPPATVSLGLPGEELRPGTTITSVGCAHGGWSTGWKGHVRRQEGGEIYFVPPPANGRSGSALFDATGRRIVGVIRARTADNTTGIATNITTVAQALHLVARMPSTSADRGLMTAGPGAALVQCPGNSCPAPIPFLLPYRYREQFRQMPAPPGPAPAPSPRPSPGSQPAWPTLPVPASPPTDLAPIAERLDKIDGLLRQMQERREGAWGSAGGSSGGSADGRSGEDQSASKVAEAARAAETAKATAETLSAETHRLRELLGQLVGEPATLLERFAARREKLRGQLGEEASASEFARAYVRDLAQEKLADENVGWTLGKILGGALGLSGPLALAIGGGLWLLSRRLGAKLQGGEPLLVQRLIERVRARSGEAPVAVSDAANPVAANSTASNTGALNAAAAPNAAAIGAVTTIVDATELKP
jgi:hypothetical protein